MTEPSVIKQRALSRVVKRKNAVTALAALIVALGSIRCGADGDAPSPATAFGDGGGGASCECGAPSAVVDAADPRCRTMPVLLTTHPHAVEQDAATVGQNLVDTRGWNGRVYFGYGDINYNTGPIVISSYDPVANDWKDHLTFNTEQIERFRVIGDHLWAPATDPHGVADPEYATGSAQHEWSEVSIGRSIKIGDVVERAPGDVYLVGDDYYTSDAGTFDNTFGGTVWRSQDGGPFDRVFPIINPNAFTDYQYIDINEVPFLNAAALNGTLYTASIATPWTFDGKQWARGPQLGGFLHPMTFANHIVFAALGELWAFDGTHRKNLGIPLFDTTLTYVFVSDPLVVANDTEGRLLVVDAKGETLMTTDLVTWQCVGQAPPDVRSVGSLNGKIIFGGAGGRVYGFAEPSW